MDENLEVFFCDVCGTSVPEKDVHTGDAKRLHGKLIGGCCISELHGVRGSMGSPDSLSPDASHGGARGLVTVGVIFLVALAAATMWIEYRVTDVSGTLRKEVGDLDKEVKHQNGLWGTMDQRLGATLNQDSIAPLQNVLSGVQVDTRALGKDVEQVLTKLDTQKAQVGGLDESLSRISKAQEKSNEEIRRLSLELLRLSQDVRELAAAPRAREPEVEEMPRVVDSGAPKAAPGLPANLQHHVSRLGDEDASTRFEATDQLIQSKDPRVLDHLLPMMKDPDLFVRRLCAEGLTKFRKKACVDALLVALADPESIVRHAAIGALKKMTGQKMAYDPDAKASVRSKAQRRWQDWWSKNSGSFK